ncbi:MAG: hypothetical protein FJW69_07335 [Actinobacteria bacterium]|nr:hypothetical protein [Actinomycetota bacterium]
MFLSTVHSLKAVYLNTGNAYDFIKNIVEGTKPEAGMYSGYKVQEVIEAAAISDSEKIWVELPLKV